MKTAISCNQLADIGIHVPRGATSFHLEAGEAVYSMGKTGKFERRAIEPDAAERLARLYKIGGTFGWEITGSGQ